MAEAKARIRYLEQCLAYLADCNAATLAHDGTLKSVSKARKERFRSIAEKSLGMITGDWSPRWRDPARELEEAKDRLRNNLEATDPRV